MNFNWPHPSMQAEYESGIYASGCTEPWIAQILYSLIVAKQEPITVLETGGYIGTTSAWLAEATRAIEGLLIICEIDRARSEAIDNRLMDYGYDDEVIEIYTLDTLQIINDVVEDGSLGFVWVDDDHDKGHVAKELAALIPKMAPKGIIAMHDVYGVTELAGICKQFGGLALDFPRIGPGGGLGIIQV